jgi:ribosomal protein L40E
MTLIGFVSFFGAFAAVHHRAQGFVDLPGAGPVGFHGRWSQPDEGPRYFWCAFVGLPTLFVGMMLLRAGYIGAVARYVAEEGEPVAKDTFNYMADGTKDEVRSVAEAIGEGLGLRPGGPEADTASRCPKCGHANQPAAKFCDSCGAALAKVCPACNAQNEPAAHFCEGCGKKFEL